MQHNRECGVANDGKINFPGDVRSQWLIGGCTVIIAALPIGFYAFAIAEIFDGSSKIVTPLLAISAVSSILCLFWGLLIYRRFRWWGRLCLTSFFLTALGLIASLLVVVN